MSSTAVPALDKTFQILDLITDSPHPLTAAHIAKELALPQQTCHLQRYGQSLSSRLLFDVLGRQI